MGAIRLKHSIGISVAIHALLLLALLLAGIVGPRSLPTPRQLTWIEVEPLAAPSSKTAQVVQTEKGDETTKAAPDAFLGERTQIVDRQQVSIQKNGEAVAQKKSRTQPKDQARPMPQPAQALPQGAGGPLAKLGVALPQPGIRPEDIRPAVKEEIGSLSAQAQGEYVKGYAQGERTMLNTREYVFFGYFQRIREKLDRAWEHSLRQKLDQYFYRGRQLASDTDYTTRLLVTLDGDGQVTRVQIIGISGTRDLDDAAVKAFNEAGPFPNPPRGLVEANGKIQVRWDFVLRT